MYIMIWHYTNKIELNSQNVKEVQMLVIYTAKHS